VVVGTVVAKVIGSQGVTSREQAAAVVLPMCDKAVMRWLIV
jgi:hypothetical protein